MLWVSRGVEANAVLLAPRITKLLSLFGESRKLNSGFRDMLTNKITPGADPYSEHILGAAGDIEDKNRKLGIFCLNNPTVLIDCDLHCEPLHLTPSWLHVQLTSVPSGLRITK